MAAHTMHGRKARARRLNPFTALGPGLITGAADDDPSGIATYSQAGAQFGLQMLWTMVLTYPFMSVVQSICARIGRVTGKGLTENIRAIFPAWVVSTVVALVLVANTLNVAADLAAMGDSAQLVLGGNRHVLTIAFALFSLALQVFVPYHRYVRFLKWLTLSLFAYVAVGFMVHVPWLDVLHHVLLPHFKFDAAAATLVVGIFGTTISPYLFFWQASEEVEEIRNHKGARPLRENPTQSQNELARIDLDTWTGMGFSNAIAFFIILSTAVTLNAGGITNIQTAAQAASALRPLAGNFAFWFFALGIVSTGLLAVPVLAGSAAYALAEARGWKEGLEHKLLDAREFYSVIAFAILAGVALDFSPIDPIKALFWSAVLNGVTAVPLMAVIMLLVMRKKIMGKFTATRVQLVLGWAATAIMTLVAAAMFVFR
jgi:NRAMP (natural resistance-associated macrophage protein)-like metal ion transporter